MKPVDLQVNMTKAVEAGRAQQIMQSSSQLAQQHLAAEADEEHRLAHSRTAQSEQAEQAENRIDVPPDQGRHGRGRRRQPSGEGGEPDEEQSPSPSDSSFIDVVA